MAAGQAAWPAHGECIRGIYFSVGVATGFLLIRSVRAVSTIFNKKLIPVNYRPLLASGIESRDIETASFVLRTTALLIRLLLQPTVLGRVLISYFSTRKVQISRSISQLFVLKMSLLP